LRKHGNVFDTTRFFTRAEQESALKKLTTKSEQYGARSVGPGGLSGFDGASMTPAVLSEQLKRTFNIKFTKQELGSIVAFFDKDGDGTVDCGEFLTEFFMLGREAKRKKHELAVAHARVELARHEIEISKRREQQKADEDGKLAAFNDVDFDRALAKISHAAHKYDRRSIGDGGLRGFEGGVMAPLVFREQLFRTFNVRLTFAELGAVMTHFDHDGDGTIESSEVHTRLYKCYCLCVLCLSAF
jgi:hypothetical protein